MATPILQINNLHVSSSDKPILHDISLNILPSKVYAIMGPNGAGKSTLVATLAGKPGYEVTQGQVLFNNHNLLQLNPQQRAAKGLFLAFQHPVSLPGVSIINFLKTSINQLRIAKQLPPLPPLEAIQLIKEKAALINLPYTTLQKSLNENFSGGEKKLNELLQMLVLDPLLIIMDEIDSGLDLDMLRLLGSIFQKTKQPHKAYIIITHNPNLFQYIIPDVVHILNQGKLIQTGDLTLAQELLKKGYKHILQSSSHIHKHE